MVFDLLHTRSLDCQINNTKITLVRHRRGLMGLKRPAFSELCIDGLDANMLRENVKVPVVSWFVGGRISFTSRYRFEYKAGEFYTEPAIDSHNVIAFRDIRLRKPCLFERPIPLRYNLLCPVIIDYYNKHNNLKFSFDASAKDVKNDFAKNFGQEFLNSYLRTLPSKWTLFNSFFFGKKK